MSRDLAGQSILERTRSRHGIEWFGWSFILPRRRSGAGLYTRDASPTDDLTIKPSLAGLELTVPDRWELERADRIARQLSDFLPDATAVPGRDRERATSLMIAHECCLHSAERSLRWSARVGDRTRKERAERDLA